MLIGINDNHQILACSLAAYSEVKQKKGGAGGWDMLLVVYLNQAMMALK